MTHRLTVRVYYEDVDLAGIVYYANYLRFYERGRSEALRALGVDQARLKAEGGRTFAVTRVEVDYLAPARFDDLLEVQTVVASVGAASLRMDQAVLRGERVLNRARVAAAFLDAAGRPTRLPAELRARLAEAASP